MVDSGCWLHNELESPFRCLCK